MGRLDNILEDNPDYNLLSKGKLKKRLELEGITKKEIDDYFDSREINQVYAKPKSYKTLKITAPPYSYQVDIAFLPAYKRQNNGIEAFMVFIDILSRKAFCYPIKSRKMSVIIIIYKKFLNDVEYQISSISGDDEFNSKEFLDLNKELTIQVKTDISAEDHLIKGKGDKLGIIDRFIRTIKKYIQKYMLIHNNYAWTKYLDKLVDLYNNTSNQGIKDMTPNEVYSDFDYMLGLYKGQNKYNQKINETFDLKPGDIVRKMLGKKVFEKEKQKFSTKLYTINEQDGYKFILEYNGKILKRKYRPSELLKVDKVIEPLSNKKNKIDKEHKKINKTKKALNITYDDAIEAIENKNEPKSKRIIKKPSKLDL